VAIDWEAVAKKAEKVKNCAETYAEKDAEKDGEKDAEKDAEDVKMSAGRPVEEVGQGVKGGVLSAAARACRKLWRTVAYAAIPPVCRMAADDGADTKQATATSAELGDSDAESDLDDLSHHFYSARQTQHDKLSVLRSQLPSSSRSNRRLRGAAEEAPEGEAETRKKIAAILDGAKKAEAGGLGGGGASGFAPCPPYTRYSVVEAYDKTGLHVHSEPSHPTTVSRDILAQPTFPNFFRNFFSPLPKLTYFHLNPNFFSFLKGAPCDG
jgi:hypothetical protein